MFTNLYLNHCCNAVVISVTDLVAEIQSLCVKRQKCKIYYVTKNRKSCRNKIYIRNFVNMFWVLRVFSDTFRGRQPPSEKRFWKITPDSVLWWSPYSSFNTLISIFSHCSRVCPLFRQSSTYGISLVERQECF